jgi:mannose-6-phosphate isomerase
LTGTVQHYAWGSTRAIPALLGVEPDGRPWAELWLGAHPSAPSRLDDGTALDAAIAADPARWLGAATAARFGGLPYLLKVLSAGQPLSLQAHPSLAQAAEGFARENDLGIALGAPNRVYKDANHKPELICALTEFDALCGFRPLPATVELLHALASRGAVGLAPFAAVLDGAGADPAVAASALRHTVGTLLTMAPGDQGHLVEQTAAACERVDDGPYALSAAWMVRLAGQYGDDVGAVVSLLLNCLQLQPGEAIFLGAGNLHAYLRGTGVEIMANSDNVLRGGLTPKHVDVPELLRVLDFTPLDDPRFAPVGHHGDGVRYAPPVPEFSLHDSHAAPVHGPEIWLCTQGEVAGLRRGQAAFVEAGSTALPNGPGTVYRAGIGVD